MLGQSMGSCPHRTPARRGTYSIVRFRMPAASPVQGRRSSPPLGCNQVEVAAGSRVITSFPDGRCDRLQAPKSMNDLGIPFNPLRERLYTPEELFGGFDPADDSSYARCPDLAILSYFWSHGVNPTRKSEAAT